MLQGAIRSVKTAAKYYGGTVEIIVVCNRCTDRTADIGSTAITE